MERRPVDVFRAVAAVRGCPASGAADHLGNPNAEQNLGFQDIYYLNRFTFDSADRWSHTCNIDYKVTINGNYFENVVGSGYEKGFVDGVFFGSEHEHMGSTVKRTDLMGVFGGSG